ncbi:transcription termination factor Rho [Actinacidiphila glaucinigra]|uniref:transcription termination factor Rho n=1 Tax=Actinacidiphila glaucinigra TaxID=235986 RepID=UPI003868D4CD
MSTNPSATMATNAIGKTGTTTAPPAPRERLVAVAGILDVEGGRGFLRTAGYAHGPHDVPVPPEVIRRYGLRKGDVVEGVATAGRSRALVRAEQVCGRAADQARGRRHFADLTPLHPSERLRLECSKGGLTTRVVDLLAPVGKGQRGLIVAPPKAGKTMLLRRLADAVADNHPECHLMVVLLDERPEEVTEMRRSVRGEVVASTFDRTPRQHIAVAELAVERAKRLVETGRDVVVLLDSLTRLCRAHNNAASSGGRTLSGGVDAAALLGPKRLFGSARLAEEGGSLTILATALVDTGSRADDYFFEELKSTGNMELRLDRGLADRRVFPAVDVAPSGTRREELLLSPAELSAARGLRRALRGPGSFETLLERLRATPDNAAFLRQIRGTVPAA